MSPRRKTLLLSVPRIRLLPFALGAMRGFAASALAC
jgi:hypothetical protein